MRANILFVNETPDETLVMRIPRVIGIKNENDIN